MKDSEAFVEHVRRFAVDRSVDVLIPITDASLLAILPCRERFPSVRIPFPSIETFRQVSNKAAITDRARALGISTPQQRLMPSRKDLDRLAGEDLEFPLVVKPARSISDTPGAWRKTHVLHAADWSSLQAGLTQLPADAYPLLLQRRVIGPGVGIFLLLWEGALLASFAHRRLREKPPAGGVSVYCESIAADPGLVDRSRALLEACDWTGVAMVEYKIDAASGEAFLMEVNGRFWGSLQLAVDAGVDFPSILVELAQGRAPDPVLDYETGVRSRWWWGDVDHLIMRLRRSDSELSLPESAPSRGRMLREFLRLWRSGDRSQVFRGDDPGPFMRETIDWLTSAVKR
jgi:predicted ATP-grasp superfamily ATP-dependent carboligase